MLIQGALGQPNHEMNREDDDLGSRTPKISIGLDDWRCSQHQERDHPRIQKETPKDEFLLPLVSLGMVQEYG
jgi:hypothetical protein